MIKVTINNIEASFDYMNGWKCDDEDIGRILKVTFDENELSSEDVYRQSKFDSNVCGIDAYALDAITHLGKIEVIENVPEKIPEETEGVLI